MDIFIKRRIEPGKLTDVYTDLYAANEMVNSCSPKILDTFCRLNKFLEIHEEYKNTSEYKVIFKDNERIRKDFIDNCMI